GAGTTYAMLDEAIRRQARGAAVMVGCVTTHDRPATLAKLAELIGTDPLDCSRSRRCPESSTALDVAAIVDRRPAAVIIDDLAFDNPPGSPNAHRWQDVETILQAGIDVITTLTVQHIESLSDLVERIVGHGPDAHVPDEFLRRADQIELVDITPEAIRRRIAHGNVFGRDHLDPTSSELFNTDAFAQLRSLLLFWMADHVAVHVVEPSTVIASHITEAREHVVVAVTGAPTCDAVIRRAARIARRSRAPLAGVHVRKRHSTEVSEVLDAHRALLHDVGGSFHEIDGDDVAASLLSFAEAEGATQLVLGTSGGGRVRGWVRALGLSGFVGSRHGSVVDEILHRTPDVDVHVISHRRSEDSSRQQPWRWSPAVLTRRRQLGALLLGAIGLAALTVGLVATREMTSVSTALALYLLAVVAISATGGRLPGVIAAVAAPLLANWFLIEPYHTLRVNDGQNAIELAVFVSVAVIVSSFVSVAAQRSVEAERARREAAALAALAGSGGPDALQSITDLLRDTFGLDGVAVLHEDGGDTDVVATSGPRAPIESAEGDFSEPIAPGVVVAARGRTLTADEHRVLRAFLLQLSKALEQHHIASIAAEADARGRADELRTAILRAVSHDLRSPLASIKASVSSLRQHDVRWPEETRDEFLASIEDETDRLTAIVTNLLDMSRLQAGVVRPVLRPVSLEEVVPAALHSLGDRAATVSLNLPAGIADVSADPALLERIVANLVTNAVDWSPPDDRVQVMAHQRSGDVQIYVIDHGPGIHPKNRSTVRRPFHRLLDSSAHGGVGLGLAIADGLTVAMGGALDLRDTPRGGLTAVVTLPMAMR
ncbi:MAG: DUF4118 domain-containing protein, partial [Acidimicrobiia bacterium]